MAKLIQSIALLALLLIAFCVATVQATIAADASAVVVPKKKKWAFSKYTGPVTAVDGLLPPPLKSSHRVGDYNFLIFALQKCSSSSPWTIHGLWPSYTDTTGPSYCSGADFDPSQISDIMSELQQVWPTCPWGNNSEDDFLSHEWQKHGTCTNVDEHTYFSDVIDIYNQGGWKSYCDNESGNECKVQVNSL